MQLFILMPVYEDWESASLLCAAIDAELQKWPALSARILLVDDGSSKPMSSAFDKLRPIALEGLWLLRLSRNLGHQRAIAVALAYAQGNIACDAVIVMDGDGEDRPEDIPRLVQEFEKSQAPVAVFAERGRRVEGLSFRLFYLCYRALHYLLTGRGIRVGNFSLLPAGHLNSIVTFPELWNHYAGALLKSKLPYTTLRADRGHRLCGKSKMSFVSLVVHGLSALFASYEIVSTRMLVGATILAITFCCLIGAVALIKFFTALAIPGWATLAAGLLFVLILQILGASATIIFSVMMSRNNLGFLPVRDYAYFVSSFSEIKAP